MCALQFLLGEKQIHISHPDAKDNTSEILTGAHQKDFSLRPFTLDLFEFELELNSTGPAKDNRACRGGRTVKRIVRIDRQADPLKPSAKIGSAGFIHAHLEYIINHPFGTAFTGHIETAFIIPGQPD